MEVAELGEMDNSEMVQTLQWGAYIKIVNNSKVTANDSESENCIN